MFKNLYTFLEDIEMICAGQSRSVDALGHVIFEIKWSLDDLNVAHECQLADNLIANKQPGTCFFVLLPWSLSTQGGYARLRVHPCLARRSRETVGLDKIFSLDLVPKLLKDVEGSIPLQPERVYASWILAR
jgi:hypothetical protein